MQLTSHTDYALRLLIYLMLHRSRKVSTREVADAYSISLHHLTKVAKSLTKGGWIVSSKGGGGGLMLAAQTPEAKLGELVRFTETSCDLAECFKLVGNTCPLTTACHLKPVLYRARQAFFAVLDSVTIGEVSRNPDELRAIFGTS